MELKKDDFEDLAHAKRLLENPGLAAKIVNLVGTPIEKGIELLPKGWAEIIHGSAKKALEKAFDFAIKSMRKTPISPESSFPKLTLAASGGIAGALGLAALPVELPFSTLMLMRSIADIARSEGEDIQSAETKLALVEVFAFGGGGKEGAAETGYYAVRASLATMISDASRGVAEGRLVGRSGSVLLRFIEEVAGRFGIVVSEKTMAAAVPVIGAAGGALINIAFLNHFRDVARGHFIIRRLERTYGHDFIRAEYEKIPIEE
jgi:hypothetical protein